MNKQQAAEAKYPFHPEDDVKDKEEIRGLRDAHVRGWESREALLSPTDGVAFARFLLNERYVYYSDSTAINIQELYKLFNPSGAAPQAAVKNHLSDKSIENIIKDAFEAASTPMDDRHAFLYKLLRDNFINLFNNKK